MLWTPEKKEEEWKIKCIVILLIHFLHKIFL